MHVCVCLPVCTHMFPCVYMRVHMCVETEGQCWLSFPIATHLVCGEKVSLTRDLMDSASYVSQQTDPLVHIFREVVL